MTDFSKALIRCSAIGHIMKNGKGSYTDADELKLSELKLKPKRTDNQEKQYVGLLTKKADGVLLSETCKKYLIRTYALEKYNRISDEPMTKQMYKGIQCEEDSIDLFCKVEKVFYSKNKEKIKNEFLSGTPDLFDGSTVFSSQEIIDIKSSWDITTYLKNIDGALNPLYYWQIQGYMAISGAKVGTIAYCLVNTPDEIINDEKRRLFFKMGVATEENPKFLKEVAKMERNMRFDDIPIEERVLRFTVERNDNDIERIYEKVKKCRLFLADFEVKHLFFTKNHRREVIKSMQNVISDTEYAE